LPAAEEAGFRIRRSAADLSRPVFDESHEFVITPLLGFRLGHTFAAFVSGLKITLLWQAGI